MFGVLVLAEGTVNADRPAIRALCPTERAGEAPSVDAREMDRWHSRA